jgi:hypothetical protein
MIYSLCEHLSQLLLVPPKTNIQRGAGINFPQKITSSRTEKY